MVDKVDLQEHVRMFKTYGTSVNTCSKAASPSCTPGFLPPFALLARGIGRMDIVSHKIASPWCSPSKPNAASFFCFDLSAFFLFASSAFFNAKTCSTDACSKGLGT